MGFWQTRILFYSPILIVRDPIATLYQEGEDASVFKLSDLTVVQGNLAKGIVFLTTALLGMAVEAIGLSSALEASMSLSLSPTQRLHRCLESSGATSVFRTLDDARQVS